MSPCTWSRAIVATVARLAARVPTTSHSSVSDIGTAASPSASVSGATLRYLLA